MGRPWKQVLRKTLTVGLKGVALGLALLVAALWLEHSSSLELPRPTGPFAVGRIGTSWVDSAREDPFAPRPGLPRELVVWIWYPARTPERAHEARATEYLPEPWRRALARHAGVLLTHLLMRNPAKVRGHSLEGPEVAPDRPTYPVVLFKSGIGALALQYSTLIEDLASHGYIVVGTDTPYSTSVVVMPDGRVLQRTDRGNPGEGRVSGAQTDRAMQAVMEAWTGDTRFELDQIARLNESDPRGKLTGRLDLSSVGIAGHSVGGATAAQVCHDDSRCKAGVDIDGALHGSVVPEGVGRPFLFLLSDHSGEGQSWTAPNCQICEDIRSATKRDPADSLIVTLLGAHHFSSGDAALTQSRIFRSVLRALGAPGGLDPRTGLATSSRYVREFFDIYLRNLRGPGGAARERFYSAPLMAGARFERKETVP